MIGEEELLPAEELIIPGNRNIYYYIYDCMIICLICKFSFSKFPCNHFHHTISIMPMIGKYMNSHVLYLVV